jgi:hypothetical protein
MICNNIGIVTEPKIGIVTEPKVGMQTSNRFGLDTETTSHAGDSVMPETHSRVIEILENDYINNIENLSAGRLVCTKVANIGAISSFGFTASSSILAFAAGFTGLPMLSFGAGICGVMSMVSIKMSYFANSQSQYRESSLKNALTSGYQFLRKFIDNPLSIPNHRAPSMPDLDVALSHSPDQSEVLEMVSKASHTERKLPLQNQPPPPSSPYPQDIS